MGGTVFITGASSGIGAALARELSGRGWSVGLVARRAELLQALARELGSGCAWAEADVSQQASVERAFAALEERLGPCDLLVANAGVGSFTWVRGLDAAEVRRVMEVNFGGAVNAVAAVLPSMLDRRRGHLVAISSLAAYRGLPLGAAYSASKAALSTFMESIRQQLRGTGVAVTTVHPGYVDTPMTAVNRHKLPFLLPADVFARRVADGLEKGRVEINLPWQMAWFLGLLRLAPNWLSRP